jgi:hypothetical protein
MPYRSAVTGEYVTDEYAKSNPDTTVWEEEPEDKTDDAAADTEQEDPERSPSGG